MRSKELPMTTIKSVMAKYGIKIVYYIDRLHFYTDTRTHKDDLASMIAANPKNKLDFKPLTRHEHLDKKVKLFQPDKDVLTSLSDGSVISGDSAINYIEFAIDCLVPNQRAREQLQCFFDKHLVYNRKPNKAAQSNFHFILTGNKEVKCECKRICTCKTRYFTPASDKQRMAIYSDKLSKTDNTSICIHIEKRFTGLKEIKKLGLYTFNNVIHFDHDTFWQQHLDLRVPNFTELGRLNLFNEETSRGADYKRGKKEWSTIDTLQKYLRNVSHCEPAFKKMITKASLEQQLAEYFD